MAKFLTNSKGIGYLELHFLELISYSQIQNPVCDECLQSLMGAEDIILIPILNEAFCSKCVKDILDRIVDYPEDRPIRLKREAFYKDFFGIIEEKPEPMKALSVWQPYAQLIMIGEKGYETRGRHTHYRGKLAIQASMKDPYSIYNQLPTKNKLMIQRALKNHGRDLFGLPIGAVIGTVELVGCYPIVKEGNDVFLEMLDNKGWCFGLKPITGDELLFGDFSPGRWAWDMQNPVLFDKPVPAKGQQSLWNWAQ